MQTQGPFLLPNKSSSSSSSKLRILNIANVWWSPQVIYESAYPCFIAASNKCTFWHAYDFYY